MQAYQYCVCALKNGSTLLVQLSKKTGGNGKPGSVLLCSVGYFCTATIIGETGHKTVWMVSRIRIRSEIGKGKKTAKYNFQRLGFFAADTTWQSLMIHYITCLLLLLLLHVLQLTLLSNHIGRHIFPCCKPQCKQVIIPL